MLSRDILQTANSFTQTNNSPIIKAGVVVSVQSDRTITVTLAGDTTQVAGVRYIASIAPRPNAVVWVLVQGGDLFAFGHLASADATLAPRASRSTSQTIADATDTAISFDGVNSDTWGCWNVSNAARLTAPVTGRYMMVGTAHFAGNATGVRSIWLEKTGTSTLARVQHISAGAGLPTWLNVTSQPVDMIGGTDYVRLMVRQNSGEALDVNSSSTFSPSLSLIYLGP